VLIVVTMASEELTKTIAYIVLVVVFVGMAWMIYKRAIENRKNMLEANAPKVAGEDVLGGGRRTRANLTSPMKRHWKKWPICWVKTTKIN